jgi:hypothetical protein
MLWRNHLWGLISRFNSKDSVPGAASICYVPELIDAPHPNSVSKWTKIVLAEGSVWR